MPNVFVLACNNIKIIEYVLHKRDEIFVMSIKQKYEYAKLGYMFILPNLNQDDMISLRTGSSHPCRKYKCLSVRNASVIKMDRNLN